MPDVQVFEGNGDLPPEWQALKKENIALKEEQVQFLSMLHDREETIKQLHHANDELVKRLDELAPGGKWRRPMERPKNDFMNEEGRRNRFGLSNKIEQPTRSGEWMTPDDVIGGGN